MYKPVDPYSRMQSTYNYNMRGGAYPPRYVPVLLIYRARENGGGAERGGENPKQAPRQAEPNAGLRVTTVRP